MSGRFIAALAALAIYLSIPLGSMLAQQQVQPFASDEVLVKYRATANNGRRNAIVSGRAASLLRRSRSLDVDHVRLPPGQNVAAAIAAFRATPDVLLVQPNYIRRATASGPPNDPWWLFGFLWGVERVQAQPAWSLTTGDAGVVVADIDTGVDYTHPDLAANMWRNSGEVASNGIDDDVNGYVDDVFGIDTANHDGDPMDDNGHGTHTAGTIGARGNNGVGVVGVTWQTSILACKFLDAQGSGTDAGAIECFDYLLSLKQHGVDIRVSNNSWGAPREAQPAVVLKDVIDTAGAAGILNVFSAGNAGTNNDTSPLDPASFESPSIISVGASDESDGRASISNFGVNSVDLAAPGTNILSTFGGSYGVATGSSMAAPHVSGAAALVVARNPSISVDSLKTLLMQSADVVPQWAGLSVTSGRLNVFNAVSSSSGNDLPSVSITSPSSGSSFVRSVTVTVSADATDEDGTISDVSFFANGVALGTDTTAPYAASWTPAVAGTYALTAIATDNGGASRESAPITVTVSPPAGRTNVAFAAYGAVVTASSFSTGCPTTSANNGDRRGTSWGNGGGWADGTPDAWPDWVEVQFNAPQMIEEIDLFTVQDNASSPVEPTPTMTFTKWGIVDFTVQYWTGTAWQTVPGGTVTANNKVWRQLHFTAISTPRIRVQITKGKGSYSRITEIEAYATLGSFNNPPSVSIVSPANDSTFIIPTTVPLSATAADTDGSIAGVSFYANGTLLGPGAGSGGTYTFEWPATTAGVYSVTAVATDNTGLTRTSAPTTVRLTTPGSRVNVARASNGGIAIASSTYGAGYGTAGAIDGDRKGVNFGNGGGWADGTRSSWPDWLEVQFNGSQTIEEINVFTVQDNVANSATPTPGMTFTEWGIQDFAVEYWTGSGWQTVPNGTVTNNNLVWRQFIFTPLTTSRIRVSITKGKASYSRVVEVEAFTTPGSVNGAPTVSLSSPVQGAILTAGANVSLSATAADSDGTVSGVDFYANTTLLGTGAAAGSLYTLTWPANAAGTYAITAVATDNNGATSTTAPVTVTVVPPGGRVNVALASSGATVVASSTLSASYPALSVINGDRKGVSWGNGGGWVDHTSGQWPDWLEVQFSGPKVIEEIDVFVVQDNYANPAEPTPAMTFTLYGLQDFTLQYWTGTAWQTVSGGSVVGNNKVWRQFSFAPITTSRIRIHVTKALQQYSRLIELEAWSQP